MSIVVSVLLAIRSRGIDPGIVADAVRSPPVSAATGGTASRPRPPSSNGSPEIAADPDPNAVFSEVERNGFRLQLQVRATVLMIVAASFFFTVPSERALTYALFCLLLALLGWAVQRTVARVSAVRWRLLAAALILLDVSALSVVLAMPGVVLGLPWPPQMAMRFFSFLYLPLYVMGSALTTSPALVLWAGASASAAWSACVWWVLEQPETKTVGNLRLADTELAVADQLRIYLDPHFVSIVSYQAQVLLLLLGSSVLAFGVWRSRRFLLERTRMAAERRNLARFVPANLVDHLATAASHGTVRRRPVAVMFADIVGYTALAERLEPEAALAVLAEFRERLTRTTLEHGGTIDKFIGDAVMATFGTGEGETGLDARSALRCALGAADALERWNAERTARGEDRLHVGVGLHCGEALVGTIGTGERLEHTVIGDVVNVASRLERLTRECGTPLLVSERVFAAAGREGLDRDLSDRFAAPEPFAIRGRSGGIDARSLRTAD